MNIKNIIKWELKKRRMQIFSFFTPIKKQILFDSFGGKQYSDNPRAISETMHRLYPDFSLVWTVSQNHANLDIMPPYVKTVEKNSLDYYKTMLESFAVVNNENFGPGIYKREEQFFIQTWHGDRVPKKVLYDAWEGGNRPIPVMDRELTNLCIAASDIGESVYRTAFRYSGEVLKVGMPRNDKLVQNNEEEKNGLRKRWG